jgi:hypothetical protein
VRKFLSLLTLAASVACHSGEKGGPHERGSPPSALAADPLIGRWSSGGLTVCFGPEEASGPFCPDEACEWRRETEQMVSLCWPECDKPRGVETLQVDVEATELVLAWHADGVSARHRLQRAATECE